MFRPNSLLNELISVISAEIKGSLCVIWTILFPCRSSLSLSLASLLDRSNAAYSGLVKHDEPSELTSVIWGKNCNCSALYQQPGAFAKGSASYSGSCWQ